MVWGFKKSILNLNSEHINMSHWLLKLIISISRGLVFLEDKIVTHRHSHPFYCRLIFDKKQQLYSALLWIVFVGAPIFPFLNLKAILRDLLISAPSIYILLNKFSIKNRQYLVNMKAIGVVVMTQSAIITKFLYRDPSKAYNVVLNGRACCVQYSISCKVPSMNTLRAYNTVTTRVITKCMMKKKKKSKIFPIPWHLVVLL